MLPRCSMLWNGYRTPKLLQRFSSAVPAVSRFCQLGRARAKKCRAISFHSGYQWASPLGLRHFAGAITRLSCEVELRAGHEKAGCATLLGRVRSLLRTSSVLILAEKYLHYGDTKYLLSGNAQRNKGFSFTSVDGFAFFFTHSALYWQKCFTFCLAGSVLEFDCFRCP